MEQKTSDQLVHSSEHPDSPDMHCNEAYVCSYSASDENLLSGVSAKPSPVMHSGKIDDAKRYMLCIINFATVHHWTGFGRYT